MNDLTLIIPAKNESESLPRVIDSLKNLTCKIKVSLQIMIGKQLILLIIKILKYFINQERDMATH
jgi:glycosyltransferase involved in cell wall biosynthesis